MVTVCVPDGLVSRLGNDVDFASGRLDEFRGGGPPTE